MLKEKLALRILAETTVITDIKYYQGRKQSTEEKKRTAFET